MTQYYDSFLTKSFGILIHSNSYANSREFTFHFINSQYLDKINLEDN